MCVCAGSQESDSSQTAKKDMLAALRARQEALEETLKQRIEELKNICIREAVRTETNLLKRLYNSTTSLFQKLARHQDVYIGSERFKSA